MKNWWTTHFQSAYNHIPWWYYDQRSSADSIYSSHRLHLMLVKPIECAIFNSSPRKYWQCAEPTLIWRNVCNFKPEISIFVNSMSQKYPIFQFPRVRSDSWSNFNWNPLRHAKSIHSQPAIIQYFLSGNHIQITCSIQGNTPLTFSFVPHADLALLNSHHCIDWPTILWNTFYESVSWASSSHKEGRPIQNSKLLLVYVVSVSFLLFLFGEMPYEWILNFFLQWSITTTRYALWLN